MIVAPAPGSIFRLRYYYYEQIIQWRKETESKPLAGEEEEDGIEKMKRSRLETG